MSTDLIHPRVRREFRELSSAWGTLRLIRDAFESEGFVAGNASDEDGQRRGLFDAYSNDIDWTDYEQVSRVLRVFEEILSWLNGGDEQTLSKLRRLLDHDGYTLDDQRQIRQTSYHWEPKLPLEHIRDATSIVEHLGRLDPSDPPLAISSAKALVEATCKHVLEELGTPYHDKADIPSLVRSVQKTLKVSPDTIAPTAKGRETIVRILSNLSQVTVGIAELRNEYGPDHGRTRPSGGLGPRHAQLAVGAAHTYCCFLLDTLNARQSIKESS